LFTGVSEATVGVNQYVFYRFNDCWGFGGRLEWFRQGGEVLSYTAGVNYRPHANVLIRPEYRYDDYTGVIPKLGMRNDSGMLAVDVILTF
jgi:hypothetical protein